MAYLPTYEKKKKIYKTGRSHLPKVIQFKAEAFGAEHKISN